MARSFDDEGQLMRRWQGSVPSADGPLEPVSEAVGFGEPVGVRFEDAFQDAGDDPVDGFGDFAEAPGTVREVVDLGVAARAGDRERRARQERGAELLRRLSPPGGADRRFRKLVDEVGARLLTTFVQMLANRVRMARQGMRVDQA
ncbi:MULTISPECIES: hypothetical protein [unclassified Xanthobacter]|uniref:hypothetical protein n=1 Tax=unclassified Xanthobacter TaxID=2623496 RepID=UPI001F1C7F63|nr:MULTISPECIES: hypothetical protein [unclassified Xanthobacter]